MRSKLENILTGFQETSGQAQRKRSREKVEEDELRRMVRRLREELQQRFVKCGQDCMVMLDPRQRRSGSRTRICEQNRRTRRTSKRRISCCRRNKVEESFARTLDKKWLRILDDISRRKNDGDRRGVIS